MNTLILHMAGRTPKPTGRPAAMGERLTSALNESEAAKRAGNADAHTQAEARISELVEQSRQGRAEREAREAPELSEGFGGGVHGRKPPPAPVSVGQESANALFQAALRRAHEQRRERETDPGVTICGGGRALPELRNLEVGRRSRYEPARHTPEPESAPNHREQARRGDIPAARPHDPALFGTNRAKPPRRRSATYRPSSV
jgi:hypothetical protein